MTPATYDSWTISMQREVRRGMTVEVDYNGSKGSNLQANLLNINQVPLSAVNDLIATVRHHCSAIAHAELAGELGSSESRPESRSPYREFHQSCDPDDREASRRRCGRIRSTAPSTPPNSGGDKTGRSMYHAGCR